MATIRAYTTIEQSRKLAKILPTESADMYYREWKRMTKDIRIAHVGSAGKEDLPCWSLSSLLGVLDYPQLSKDKLGSGKEGWMVSVYPDNCRYDSCWHDNPVDACYEMIIKLHEQKLL